MEKYNFAIYSIKLNLFPNKRATNACFNANQNNLLRPLWIMVVSETDFPAENLNSYLEPTPFFDYNSAEIQNLLKQIDLSGLSQKEIAVKLFYYVRDLLRYSVKPVNFDKSTYTASHVATQESSFCIPKAILLGSLARAVGIPSRLHFVDFANHRLAPELMKMWGTNVMAAHCYTELFIDGKWRKATPALDKNTCEKHDFKLVEFDGLNDGLLHGTDIHGNPHAEYVNDHGTRADMSIEFVKQIWDDVYGPTPMDNGSMNNDKMDSITFR